MERTTNNCAGMGGKLADLLLDPVEAPAKVQTHVAGCADCSRELEQLQSTMALLDTWDEPAHGGPLRAMVGGAVQDPELAQLLKEVLERELIDRIAEHIRGANARYRAAAFATQLAGVIFARYILALDPVATMTVDELVRHLSPGLRAVLRGPTSRPVRT